MTISADSRYSQTTLAVIDVDNTPRQVIVAGEQTSFTFNFTNYLVKDKDRLDLLAYTFYGDALKWWLIADANPQVMLWDTLVAGSVIRVPVVQ